MDEPKKDDFTYIGRYVSPVLFQSSLFPTFDGDASRQLLPLNSGVFLDGYEYIKKSQWDAISNAAHAAIVDRREDFFKNFFKVAREGTDRALASSRKIRSSERLTPALFKEFLTEFHEMMYPWWATLPIGEGAEKAVFERAKEKGLPRDSVGKIFEPAKPTPLMEHRRALELIRRKWEEAGRDDDRIEDDIKSHVEKFGWVGMLHLWGAPLTVEKALEEMKTLKPLKASATPTINREHLSWARPFAGELCYWRQYCADACSMVSFNVREKIDAAARDYGFEYSQIIWLTGGEFLELLEGRKTDFMEKIAERRKAYGLLFDRGKYEMITGDRLSSLVSVFVEKDSGGSVVKGLSASPGRARGVARVIWTPQEAGKVGKGDVVVASETTPDFIPAVSRAAAIVTDMGGITSHAAVISREFGIPCIVGTKTATRTFKDGDLVEVDADNGTASKLKG